MIARRAFQLALALAAAIVCVAGFGTGSAGARELEVPTFLAPGLNENESPSTIPGGRPFELISNFALNQSPAVEGLVGPAANVKNLRFELPAGMVANAAFPSCSAEAFSAGSCGTATQVGVAIVGLAGMGSTTTPVFNLAPPPGQPAQLAFRVLESKVHVDFRFRNGSDYGATATVSGLSAAAGLLTASLRVWGVPGDSDHDALRYAGNGVPDPGPYPEAPPYRPLLSNPTSCNGPMVTTMEAGAWQLPGQTTSAAAFEAPQMSGCNQLDFSPTIEAKPTTNLADSPTGFDFHIRVPQNQDPEGSATGHLRRARIALPPGFTINPAAANGLGACSLGQIGYAGVSNERQILRYEMPPANFSGSFTVSYGGRSTAPIAATATRAQVTAAIETLPGLAGNVSLAGAQGGWLVSFTGALAGRDVAQLSGTITDNPSQIVAVTGEGGTFDLQFGASSTPPLPFDATPAEVQAALRAIPEFGLGNLFPGNVFVNPAGEEKSTRFYQVIFVADLAGTQPALTATSALTGPEAGVKIDPQSPPSPRSLSVSTLGGIAPGTPQFNAAAASCPAAAKLGTARIDAPAIVDRPLFGDVYLASQDQNPFGSLLAVYVVVEDPASGLILKLPGRIDADPGTGRLTATISEAPELPFEDLRLELFKGSVAPLKTPLVCGTYRVDTEMTPWASPEGAATRPKDAFRLTGGAGAGSCAPDEASVPAGAKFEAGTVDPTAGIYSPFTLALSRPDGARPLTGIDTTLPEGLLANLTAVATCSDGALAAAAGRSGAAQRATPSCPTASRVGSIFAAGGAGPAPYNFAGEAYLAGPYKGAPLSLALLTPALAGPFDLGTVVLRTALYVDPQSTRVHALSDPFPQLLQGIPLTLRSLVLNLDANTFARNPTSCNPIAFTGPQSVRFQVGDCSKLAFAPKLDLSLVGATKRGAHPALKANLSTAGKGSSANVAAASLTLPKSVALDKSRIKAICGTAQFAAGACPAASAYDTAKVSTPLLSDPLQGPVYLRKSSRKLPDLVVDLKGRFDVVLAARLTTTKPGLVRASFENVPDAPLSKFTLTMQGGKKGLFVNSANLCKASNRATAQIDGQNTKAADQLPVLANGCKKKKAR